MPGPHPNLILNDDIWIALSWNLRREVVYLWLNVSLQQPRLMVNLAWQCSNTDWQEFNMSLPLRAHLKKLDSIPFLTVDGHLHGVIFSHTDQPVDPVNTLEFGVRVSALFFPFTDLQNSFRLLLFCGVGHCESMLSLWRIHVLVTLGSQLRDWQVPELSFNRRF